MMPVRFAELNQLSHDPHFQTTEMYAWVKDHPLGFIDVGSLGGPHPIVQSLAACTQVLCFEPEPQAFQELQQKYTQDQDFAKIILKPYALSNQAAQATLYETGVVTNSSLLPPEPAFVSRYRMRSFDVVARHSLSTHSLDHILTTETDLNPTWGECIKLDTQGTEYDILQGATQTLESETLGVICEVEFFELYQSQKLYADIDCLMRQHGLFIYGLFPQHRSTRHLNYLEGNFQERLIWADALFLKDPLDPRNRQRAFSNRHIQVLIVVAVLCGYFDFALELLEYFYEAPHRLHSEHWIRHQSQGVHH